MQVIAGIGHAGDGLYTQLPPYPRTVSLLHDISTGTAVGLAIYRQGMRAGQAHNTSVMNTLSKIGKLRRNKGGLYFFSYVYLTSVL